MPGLSQPEQQRKPDSSQGRSDTVIDADRKQREAEFHDHAFEDAARRGLWDTVYATVESSRVFYEDYLRRHAPGSDVLEYGSGMDTHGPFLIESGARSVVGIDISGVAVDAASKTAARAGATAATYRVMDAERLEFADGSFDLVCGTSIIHHLDLDRAYAELGRVLRGDGRIILIEPLGHNPIINAFRGRTPSLRTPDEHPLLMDDLRLAERYFGVVRARFVHLASLAAVPFAKRRIFPQMISALDGVDRALMRAVPPLRRHAWQVIIELADPRS